MLATLEAAFDDNEMIPLREATARIAVLLAVFVFGAVLSAIHTAPAGGTDELAHVSYIAQLQKPDAPHDLAHLKLLDPQTFRFRPVANYINHPPFYYAVLAHIGPRLEGHPGALLWFRLINVALATAGLWACFLLLPRQSDRLTFYAYAVPLLCIPVLIPLAGSVNNDNAAFLGGAVMLLGLMRLMENRSKGRLALALGGLVLASWAKLTGLMLSSGVLTIAFVWLFRERRLPATWVSAALVALVVAALPYGQLTLAYGSPAPDTAAQHAALMAMSHYAGWDTAVRLSFPVYAARFVADFVEGWLPPHDVLQAAALVLPVFAIAVAVAGTWLAARRVQARAASPDDVLVAACAIAFIGTFAVHIWFSYQRHLATGWLMDAYPRYYLPIAPLVPLAGLVAARAWPGRRDTLLVALAAAPVLLRLASAF